MDEESKKLFQKLFDRLDNIKSQNKTINDRLDKIDNRLDVMEVNQSRMSEQLTEMQLSQKLFEMNTNKKYARLQNGMDTIEFFHSLFYFILCDIYFTYLIYEFLGRKQIL